MEEESLKLKWKRTQEKCNKWNMDCVIICMYRRYILKTKLLEKVEILGWKETYQGNTNKKKAS